MHSTKQRTLTELDQYTNQYASYEKNRLLTWVSNINPRPTDLDFAQNE